VTPALLLSYFLRHGTPWKRARKRRAGGLAAECRIQRGLRVQRFSRVLAKHFRPHPMPCSFGMVNAGTAALPFLGGHIHCPDFWRGDTSVHAVFQRPAHGGHTLGVHASKTVAQKDPSSECWAWPYGRSIEQQVGRAESLGRGNSGGRTPHTE